MDTQLASVLDSIDRYMVILTVNGNLEKVCVVIAEKSRQDWRNKEHLSAGKELRSSEKADRSGEKGTSISWKRTKKF